MKQIPVELFSRVCGFYRPTSEWNPGKKSEYVDRKEFIVTQERIDNAKPILRT